MSDLAARLRGYAYGLTWGEKAQTGALSNDLRAAADALDKAEAELAEERRELQGLDLALAAVNARLRAVEAVATEFRDNFASANPDQPRIPLPWEP